MEFQQNPPLPLSSSFTFPPLPPPPSLPPSSSSSSSSSFSFLPSSLTDNPYFSAGFGLFGLGAAAAVVRQGSQQLLLTGRRLVLSSLEIPSTDKSYQWVMQWLIAAGHLRRHLGLRTTFIKAKHTDMSSHATSSFDFIPSTGTHYLNYRNRFIKLSRHRASTMVDFSTGTPWETLTLTCFTWDRHMFQELLEEARTSALVQEEGHTIIYTSVGQDWRPFGEPKLSRPFDSVILAEGVAETVRADVKEFLASRRWYFDRGIPYRRGYLLHGPPGCGKTSYVMALAGELKYNICIMNVGDPVMTDDRLHYLLATVPPRTLMLLEDIDGAINSEEAGANKAKAGDNPYGLRRVTFSGLLNALDGVVATEERLVFMTTNHIQRLPESLIRPGRIDLKIRVSYATELQLKRMFGRFFPERQEEAEEFAATLSSMDICRKRRGWWSCGLCVYVFMYIE
eukprot:GHVS01075213.1.p1 GENE.GHVS01075213.1~~GHVS01075213.1.p1  ORF type:complete len:452 (+),score=112.71 GHVS01075213.1:96-1451(+)